MSEHLATCPLCQVARGLRIKVEDGNIGGDAEHPPTRGFICPKGTALQGLHHDPDRLRSPLVRRGGKLVEASWQEAFTVLRDRLQPIIDEGGPDAVAWHLGIHNVPALMRGRDRRTLLVHPGRGRARTGRRCAMRDFLRVDSMTTFADVSSMITGR